jgi:hypothetical protein
MIFGHDCAFSRRVCARVFLSACPRIKKMRGRGAPKGATTSLRLCGGRALCVSRASPSGAPRVAFLSPGPRFLVSVPVPEAVLEAPAQRLTRPLNRAETFGAVPVQRSSSRSGRSAARAGPRGLPSAGLRTPPAGATPLPRPASVLQDAPRVGEVKWV